MARRITPPRSETMWAEFARCKGVDPDLFFPERGASTKEAKAVCNDCAVTEPCLEFALQNGEKFGIWGGKSERERRRIRRSRAVAAMATAVEIDTEAWMAELDSMAPSDEALQAIDAEGEVTVFLADSQEAVDEALAELGAA